MKRSISLTALALSLALAAWPLRAQERNQEILGAGSTFAFPVLSSWSKAYQRSEATAESQPVGAGLDYEPVGSQAGLMRLREAAVDFGATDVPLTGEELTKLGAGQFPIVIGGVVAAINIEGVAPGRLKLTGEAIADIYLGRIKTWADPVLKALNPDLTLPDAPIAALRRSDGSGTTFNFTNYLSKTSPAWKSQVGEGLVVAWRLGGQAKGNDGMAEAVRTTRNAIGYVDFAQAQRARLSYAAIRNAAGTFVVPSVESFQAAAGSADWKAASDFALLLTDAPGEASYPIVATTFAVLPKQNPPSKRVRAAIGFFRWSLDNGARTASDLGYVPLPEPLVTQIKTYWAGPLRIPTSPLDALPGMRP